MGQIRLPKRRTKMAICTSNAQTLALEACVGDLMKQARKIKYDVIVLTETRRHRALHAVFETGEELFLGTCDSRGVGGVSVLVNTHLAMNIGSYESLTTRIGSLRLKRCDLTPRCLRTIIELRRRGGGSVLYGPGDAIQRRSHFLGGYCRFHYRYINEEYNRLVEHLHDSARKAESLQVPKRLLSSETLELIRQRGMARATGNNQLTSKLKKPCREAIKEDLRERRGAFMDDAAEAGKSIRKARRSSANYKTEITSLRRLDRTVTASRRAMEKVIYDFYSDLFDSHVYLPTHHLRQDEYIAPSVLPPEIRHAITSIKNCTAPGPDRIKPEHLKSIPPVIIETLARLFTRYLSECKVPTSWKTSKTVLLYKKRATDDIGNYRPICPLSVIYKFFTRNIFNKIGRILDEGQPCEQARFRRGFSTIDHIVKRLIVDHIHTVTRLIEVSQEYKMLICLTGIDLKKAFDTVETGAVIEALGNPGMKPWATRAFLLNIQGYFVRSATASRRGFHHPSRRSLST
ncbi:hypothetical protein V3C99_017948 [Haemonchus contortus]